MVRWVVNSATSWVSTSLTLKLAEDELQAFFFMFLTSAGRAVTTIFLIAAAIIIPWQAFRIRNADKYVTETECARCGLSDHEGDARWCRQCGHPIHTQTEDREDTVKEE